MKWRHQVALGYLGQQDRVLSEVAIGDQLVEGDLGDTGGPERPGVPARMGQFEECGLARPAQQGCAVGLAPGGCSGRYGRNVGHQATALARAVT